MIAEEAPIVPRSVLEPAADYTFMSWAYGWRGRSPEGHRVLNIQTNRYGLSFDLERGSLTHLGIIDQPLPPRQAVAQSNDVIFSLPQAILRYRLQVGEKVFESGEVAPGMDDPYLLESGRFFQRMEFQRVQFRKGAGQTPSQLGARLELAAFPDRLGIILQLIPGDPPDPRIKTAHGYQPPTPPPPGTPVDTPTGVELILNLNGVQVVSAEETAIHLKSPVGGWIVLAPPGETQAALHARAAREGVEITARFQVPSDWPPDQRQDFGLALCAVRSDGLEPPPRSGGSEMGGIQVSARTEAEEPLAVSYDPLRGFHRVELPSDLPEYSSSNPRQIERIHLLLGNPTADSQTVRLFLAREGNVPGVVGISPLLRDAEGYPLGLPVQISKNWHGWVWFHGVSVLELPPGLTLPLELTIANAFWGGVPAASHAQLCLVGWGVHQLWDESAIGSFGENICYDPDVNLQRSMIDDVRPLLVWSMGQAPRQKWGWTNNVGGGDCLVYFDAAGQRQYLSRMRTYYARYGPCLTEVIYAGQTPDGCLEARMTASLYRCDDLTRGVYHLRYDVQKPLPFTRLAFFQLGADHYNDHCFKKMARGNAEGLIEEWTPEFGGQTYGRQGLPCEGRTPWFSLHEGYSGRGSEGGAWANRGLIIRSFQARLGGQDQPHPYAAVFRTQDHFPSANVELAPPPDLQALQPGDFVEAEVVMAIFPQQADDYYGPNEGLRAALAAHPNSWFPVRREAVGNDLQVEAQRGRVERSYPVRVRAENDAAEWVVTGGLGYVPMTIAGLSTYREFVLERLEAGSWQVVDQSVHGRDFWQTDFEPEDRTFALTYNVSLDQPGDERKSVAFRLRRSQGR